MAFTPIPSSGAPAAMPALSAVPDLIALRAAVSNGALKGERLPERIKIFAWGDNGSTKGIFRAGNLTAQLLAANQRALGFERVAIDYNHCTVEGSPEYVKGQPKAIFGYGTVVAKEGEGVFLEQIEWTPLGVANARNYEDLSPAAHQANGEIDFIHSVALTPNGCLYDVTFFSAAGGITKNTKETENLMSEQNKGQLDAANVITAAELAPVVGLAATASKAEVLGKFSLLAVLSGLVKDGKVLLVDTLSALDERLKAIEAAATKQVALLSATVDGKVLNFTAEDVVQLGARLVKLETAIREQAAGLAEVEKGKILMLFAADGKVPKDASGKAYTAEGLKALDLPTLKLLHANTPSTVPLSARAKALDGGDSGSAEGFAATFRGKLAGGKVTRAQALDLAMKENSAGYAAWRAANGQPGL